MPWISVKRKVAGPEGRLVMKTSDNTSVIDIVSSKLLIR